MGNDVNGIREGLQTMWAAAAEQGIDDLSRANRARVAIETAEDLAALIRSSARIFPGLGLATVRQAYDQGRPFRGPQDPRVREARARGMDSDQIVKVRGNLNNLAPAVKRALADFDAVTGGAGPIPELGSPFDAAPLMLSAEPLLAFDQLSTVVPGLPTNITGKVDASDYSLDQETLVEDVGGTPSMAGLSIPVADQVIDFTDDQGAAYLDQLVMDAVDRAAEEHIGELLLTAAGTPAEAGNDLAGAIDTAESTTAAAAQSSAGMLIVHPGDWPKVRRIVAPTWQVGPHPTPMVSVAAPIGTIILVGGGVLRVAAATHVFHSELMSGGLSTATAYDIAPGARWLSAFRYFRAIIRAADGVAAINL